MIRIIFVFTLALIFCILHRCLRPRSYGYQAAPAVIPIHAPLRSLVRHSMLLSLTWTLAARLAVLILPVCFLRASLILALVLHLIVRVYWRRTSPVVESSNCRAIRQ